MSSACLPTFPRQFKHLLAPVRHWADRQDRMGLEETDTDRQTGHTAQAFKQNMLWVGGGGGGLVGTPSHTLHECSASPSENICAGSCILSSVLGSLLLLVVVCLWDALLHTADRPCGEMNSQCLYISQADSNSALHSAVLVSPKPQFPNWLARDRRNILLPTWHSYKEHGHCGLMEQTGHRDCASLLYLLWWRDP